MLRLAFMKKNKEHVFFLLKSNSKTSLYPKKASIVGKNEQKYNFRHSRKFLQILHILQIESD